MASRRQRDEPRRPVPSPAGRGGGSAAGPRAAPPPAPPSAPQAAPRPPMIATFSSETREVVLAAVQAGHHPEFSDLVKRKLHGDAGKSSSDLSQGRNMYQLFETVCSRRMVKDAEDVNAWLQKREREIKKELEDFRAYDLADTHTDDASPQATPTPEQVEATLTQARVFLVKSAKQYVEYVESCLREGSTQTLQLMKLIQNDLKNTLENLDFDHKLSVSEVKKVVKRLDGHTPHLIAPEKAIRFLIHDCIALAMQPVETCVWNVHDSLEKLLDDAHFECGYMRYPKLYLKFQEEVHSLAKAWRESAVELAREMVIIEGIYPTHISLRQEEPAEVQEAAPKSPDADLPKLAKVDTLKRGESELARNSSETPSEESPEGSVVDRSSSQRLSESLGSTFQADPSSLLGGWFEKKSSEGKAWQRRYFVLDEDKAILYYNLKPEEKVIRGRIDLSNAKVQDPQNQSEREDGGDRTFRLHSRTEEPLVNNHLWIMLRAESPSMKYEWLARLRAAAVPPHAGLRNSAPPPPPLNTESDGQQSPTSDDSGDEAAEDSEVDTASVSFQASKSMPRLLDEDGKIEYFANTVRDYVKEMVKELNLLIPKTIVFVMLRHCHKELLPRLSSLLTRISARELQNMVRNDDMAEEWRTGAEAALEKIALGRKEMSYLCTKGFLQYVSDKRQETIKIRAMLQKGTVTHR